MLFMNEWEIDNAYRRYRDHPVLGPATITLCALRDATNACSDGWAYWPKPCRAARKLQELITGDPTRSYHDDERADATAAKLRAALAPIKALRTRESALTFEITETLPVIVEATPEVADAYSITVDSHRDWHTLTSMRAELSALANVLDALPPGESVTIKRHR